jgi:prepilin signal peptidase PulO-like enzyme (type II secretory pathway)
VAAALAILGLCLAVSVVTDLRRRLIYDVVTLPSLLALVLLRLFALSKEGSLTALADPLLGILVCAGPLLAAAWVDEKWMGMGDVKLMAVVGAAAGWPYALLCLLYVSVAGGVLGLCMVAWGRAKGREAPGVPYAVAVAAGTLAAWVWGPPG